MKYDIYKYYFDMINSDKNKSDILQGEALRFKIGDSKYLNLNETSIKALNQFYEENRELLNNEESWNVYL